MIAQIDSTMLAAYRTCPRAWHLGYHLHLRPRGDNIHLHAGGAFAAGLEATRLALISGASPADAVADGASALIRTYGSVEPATPAKSLPNLLSAFAGYWETFGFPLDCGAFRDTYTLVGRPEFSFSIPTRVAGPNGDPILYTGRFDALVSDESGLLFPLDDKTTSRLGPTWPQQWSLRGQFLGYAYAASLLGLGPVGGVLVRGIGLYAHRADFLQTLVLPSPDLIAEWWEDTNNTLSDLVESFSPDELPPRRWNDACAAYGGCDYRDICTKPTHLASMVFPLYEVRPWSPIKETEQQEF